MYYDRFIHVFRCFALSFWMFFLGIGNSYSLDWQTSIHTTLKHNSALVYDHNGNMLFSHNADQQMVPASILKLATADAVLTLLGSDYKIPTEFYLTTDNYLVIKGFGDPTLVSETLADIAKVLKKSLQAKKLKGFLFDTTFFAQQLSVHGQSNSDNPYDSSLGALVANYNTVNVYKAKSGVISSAEAQTPITATAIMAAKKTPTGKHRINLGQQETKTLQHFAELMQIFLQRQNITIPATMVHSPIPKSAKIIHTHYSPPVSQIIKTLFVYSNNFIANQLLIVLGGVKKGAPADLEKGRQVLDDFLRKVVGMTYFTLDEGSGLSRNNKINAVEMMSLLIHFLPHRDLLRNYQHRFQAKTGTLRGVATLAGYMLSPKGKPYPFVIMLKNPSSGLMRKKIANQLYQGIFSQILAKKLSYNNE